MTGKTHMLGGLLAGATIITATELIVPDTALSIAESGLFMVSSTITALLPDVDEKNSKAGRSLIIIPLALGIIRVVLFIMEMFMFGWLKKKIRSIRKSLSHRGLFHWLFTWGVLSLVFFVLGFLSYKALLTSAYTSAALLPLCLLAGFTPGYISHLLLDLISGRIQIMAPFNKKWYGKPLIKVGSLAEILLVRPVLILAIVLELYLLIK